jgi:hypothetical protein
VRGHHQCLGSGHDDVEDRLVAHLRLAALGDALPCRMKEGSGCVQVECVRPIPLSGVGQHRTGHQGRRGGRVGSREDLDAGARGLYSAGLLGRRRGRG